MIASVLPGSRPRDAARNPQHSGSQGSYCARFRIAAFEARQKPSPRQSRRVLEPIPRQHIPTGCEEVGGRAALPRGFDGNAEPVPLNLQRGVLGNALPERPKNAQKMKQRGQSWKPYRKTHSRPSQLQMVPSVLDEQVYIKHGPGLVHP